MIFGSTVAVLAAAPVERQDAVDVALHLRARVDAARFEPHLRFERLIVDLPVALEGDAVDDRVLHDVDNRSPSRLIETSANNPVANRLFSERSMRASSKGSPGCTSR